MPRRRSQWDDPIPYRPAGRLPPVKGEEVRCKVRVAGYRVVLTMGNEPYLLTPAEADKLACDLMAAAMKLDRLVADTEREAE